MQVVLSPIQELDGSGSVNNTLHAHSPGTAALAQAVLSPTLGPLLTSPVSVPMTVSQLTQLGLNSARNSPLFARALDGQNVQNPTFIQAFEPHHQLSPVSPLTLTELTNDFQSHLDVDQSGDSDVSHQSKDSIGSGVSTSTASVTSKRSLDAHQDSFDQPPSLTMNIMSEKAPVLPTLSNSSRLSTVEEAEKVSGLSPSVSAPNSLNSLGGAQSAAEAPKVRKVSVTPTASSPKRGEVYV